MRMLSRAALCLMLLSGCSEESAPQAARPHAAKPSHPPVVVNTPDSQEKARIRKQAKALFDSKDYQGLDAFARTHRQSKESYADGVWKLSEVYAGIFLPEESSEGAWSRQLGALREWIKARPESVTARIALAEQLTTYAWKARGSGWASTVTGQQWKIFKERLQESAKVLNEAKALREKCPRWYSAMLTVALGLDIPRDRYDALFSEAINAQPRYMIYYFRRAYYLLPRWNGREGEWESDLKKSADALGGEAGDILYARVVWEMHNTRFFGNIFGDTKLSWARVNAGFAAIEKAFPDSIAARSEHAYLAVLAGSFDVARNHIEELSGKVDLSVWQSPAAFNQMVKQAYQ